MNIHGAFSPIIPSSRTKLDVLKKSTVEDRRSVLLEPFSGEKGKRSTKTGKAPFLGELHSNENPYYGVVLAERR